MTELTLAQRLRVYAAVSNEPHTITMSADEMRMLARDIEAADRIAAASVDLAGLMVTLAASRERSRRAVESFERVMAWNCIVGTVAISSWIFAGWIG